MTPARAAAGRGAALAISLVVQACAPLRPFVRPPPGQTTAERIDVDGRTRTYRLHAPARVPTRALLVVLHGGGSTGTAMEETTGLSRVGDERGFAVAYPEGIGLFGWAQMWNAGHCCGRPHMLGVDDVHFVRVLVLALAAHLALPTDRVFVVGYSNGALIAHRAGSELSDLIGGIAVFAGTMRATGSQEAPVFKAAPPVRPISVFLAHGTADNRIPYGGKRDGDELDVSMKQAGRFWAVGVGCRKAPSVQRMRGGAVEIETFGECPPGASVVTVTLADWDHEWPGRERTGGLEPSQPLHDFDLGEMIGDFVSQQLAARAAPIRGTSGVR